MLQGFEVIPGTDPERALFEIRDGKFWDGRPAMSDEDRTTPVPDGFYFVVLTAGYILTDDVYGPFADAVAAESAATEINRAIALLERQGRIHRVVEEDGETRFFLTEMDRGE